MSRIGRKKIIVPSNVKVEIKNGMVKISGAKGELERKIDKRLRLDFADGALWLKRVVKNKDSSRMQGTERAHLKAMVRGVSKGFKKILEFSGTGYRAQKEGDELKLLLGYSHEIRLPIPRGVAVETDKDSITLSGIEKEVVNQFAALIKRQRSVEPYKAKGIKYKDEVVQRKVGKSLTKEEGEGA